MIHTSIQVNMPIIAEYVWIGGNGVLRSKARVMPELSKVPTVDQLPEWNFDGSSTGQADGHYSEVMIRPCAVFACPFRKLPNVLVMCDTYLPDGTAHPTNHRIWAKSVFDQKLDEEPWFGLEQEYFLIDPNTEFPLGFDPTGNAPHLGFQGPYYCSVGAGRAFGRNIVDKHLDACLYAGITISGINAEVAPGQWEFQVGPVTGIDAGDHLYMARYILNRIAEKYNVAVDLRPKPMKGEWNGSGCHTNYSTQKMREGDENGTGFSYIHDAVYALSCQHEKHMRMYSDIYVPEDQLGNDNRERMTGHHETATFDKFSSGVANRGASVRIPNDTKKNGKGYFEDRRPAANMDPYRVTGMIFETTVIRTPTF